MLLIINNFYIFQVFSGSDKKKKDHPYSLEEVFRYESKEKKR